MTIKIDNIDQNRIGQMVSINPDNYVKGLKKLSLYDGSLSQKVYGSLREAILSLRLKPGIKLSKVDISHFFGVSRSPVSEAFAKLANDGLVEIIPQSGTRVTLLSIMDVKEASFMREAIESACAAHLAEQITEDQILNLKRNMRLQKIFAEDNDFDAFYKADEEFHELILEYTGYKRVASFLDTINAQITRTRKQLIPNADRLAETIKEHQAIVDGITAHDPIQAGEMMKFHIRQLITRLETFSAEHPELFAKEAN